MKKTHGDSIILHKCGDSIILHKCTTNHDHMLYSSWDMAHDGCNCYFSFWAIFCPFTSHQPKKWKFQKKWKKGLEISSFYTCTPKIMISWCTVPEILCVTDRWMDRKSDIWRWMPHLKGGGGEGKIFEDLGKNVQNLKILWKRAGNCMRQLHAIHC